MAELGPILETPKDYVDRIAGDIKKTVAAIDELARYILLRVLGKTK